jgi:putative membrane protein
VSERSNSDDDPTRRTLLAAERTWLAWWRSGIAAITAAVAVGAVIPELVDGARTPYIVLGAGYAALGGAVFLASELRRRRVDEALRRGDWVGVGERGALALTLVALALALGTLAVIVVQP